MTVSQTKVYSLSCLLSTPSALPVSQPPPVRPHHHTLAVCPAWLNCLPSIMDTAECKYAANLVADGDLSRPCPAVCTGPPEQPADSVSSSGCRTCFSPWRQTSRLVHPSCSAWSEQFNLKTCTQRNSQVYKTMKIEKITLSAKAFLNARSNGFFFCFYKWRRNPNKSKNGSWMSLINA